MSYDDYYDDIEKPIREDAYQVQALELIKEIINKNKNDVFYTKQLQILIEDRIFHWVTARAIEDLLEKGGKYLSSRDKKSDAHVIWHRSNRYYKRKSKALARLIEKHSDISVSEGCGYEANNLFYIALTEKGFKYIGKNVNIFKRKKWIKTKHDLDYILEKDGVFYGIEIKNSFDYIDNKEMEIKLEMCEYLGLKPLFIMRNAPKTYNRMINNYGGYAMIFVSKIFPLSLKTLAKEINSSLFKKYSKEKYCDAPRSIPEGMVDRFVNWHEKHVKTKRIHRIRKGARR
ncbi:MAG: hypothetical protein ABII64_02900 [Elusimicrobiota bacterium]